MNQWKGTKCEPGYIQRQKRFQAVMLLVFIAIGIGLFLIGFVATKTRANVFTVLAILMVLPGAKRVIALVVMAPRRSVEQKRYDRMREALSPDAVLLTDYVFTSSEKIMNLDFVIVEGREVIGIRSVNERKRTRETGEYMKDYLEKGIAGVADGYRVNILDSDESFFRQYKRDGRAEGTTVETDVEMAVETADRSSDAGITDTADATDAGKGQEAADVAEEEKASDRIDAQAEVVKFLKILAV